ncbi:MAG: nitroreductase family deazaflavin-dependent oxidoreductase [Jatrophihabitantaceae bacterium]
METLSSAQFNARVVEEFRATGGHVTGPLASTPLMLVHHIGTRSGIERVTPLAYLRRPDGSFVITATNGGSPKHPAWYHNLKGNPTVTVEVGTETFRAVAAELSAADRAALWPTIRRHAPAADEYQNMTSRVIPVVILTRED